MSQVVAKVFIKPDQQESLRKWYKILVRQREVLTDISNALPYSRFLETDRAGYLIRQYIKTNLYDRISTRPFLEPIEKVWILFQLLKGLDSCHAANVYHGDIKSENILVTSWNWIYISDFAPFKPVFIPENDPSQFSFYFDTSQRRSCYVSPERFTADGEHLEPSDTTSLTPEMDIFSLGCVIAELFLEGSHIFTLAQLFKYKKGEYTPNLSGIENEHVREMVKSMIDLDPAKRLSAHEYLKLWKEKLFPEYFYTFLHDFMAALSTQNSYDSTGKSVIVQKFLDNRMNFIYENLEETIKTLGFEKLLTEDKSVPVLEIGSTRIMVKSNQNLLNMSKDDGALIILNVVLSTVRNVSSPTLKVNGCDLILALGLMINDEAKLDRCLPYLLALLDDNSEIVQIQAIRNLTQLLGLIKVIAPINGDIFLEYIFPKLDMILLVDFGRSVVVRTIYASCLPTLATIASRFLEMSQILKTSGMLDSFDPETENGTRQGVIPFDLNRQGLVDKFEEHTIALLSDSDNYVRKALLKNIFPLCLFFGKQKTNDVILSHILTYLNDPDSSLKRQFFDCIIALGPYIGSTALEQYIQPLMLQALYDLEEFVTAKTFETYASFSELGLIKRQNVSELLTISVRYAVHPNPWIRLAAFEFISNCIKWASPAETYCIIYPIIRPFLQNDITDFSQATLVANAIAPLSRPLFNSAVSWATKAQKSHFWKAALSPEPAKLPEKFRDVKISTEDQKWIQRLCEMGATESDLWKIAVSREYLYKIAGAISSSTQKPVPKSADGEMKEQGNNVVNLIRVESLKIKVHEFVFTDEYEQSSGAQRLDVAVSEQNALMDITVGENGARVEPSATTGTVTTDVYGTVEQPFAHVSKNSEYDRIRETEPFVAKFLDNVHVTLFSPQPSFYGPQVVPVTYADHLHNLVGTKPNWQPASVLASQFADHKSTVNKIEVTPDHSFFLTCSDDGTVKIWDCFRLEKNVINRSIQTYKPQTDEKLPAAKFLCFLENSYTFVVSYSNGLIEFVRIDVLLMQNESRAKFRRFVPVHKYMLASNEYATWMKHVKINESSLLIISTTKGRIIGYDVNTFKDKFEFKSPAAHGIPTCFVIDLKKAWLLVGTLQGVLDLYDLRFLVLIKTWTFKNATAIRRLYLRPKSKGVSFFMLGGTSLSEASIWDITDMTCKAVYSVATSVDPTKSYYAIPFEPTKSLVNVKDSDHASLLSMAVGIDPPKEANQHIYMITGGSDKKLRFWDINSLDNCCVISGASHPTKFYQTFNNVAVKIVAEKAADQDAQFQHRSKPTRTSVISMEQQELARNHQATITDVIVIYKPYQMVVSADRLGVVKVFM